MIKALSPREKEILTLIRDDHSNKQIGLVLGISKHTVKNQVAKILLKLGVATRTGAVVKALRMGIINL